METATTLELPREPLSVPVVRAVLGIVLDRMDADTAKGRDLQLALSEACTNAVVHAEGVATFRLDLKVVDHVCELEVVDEGPGFEVPRQAEMPGTDAVGGRGLALMDGLVEVCEVVSRPGAGTRVRLRADVSRQRETASA